MSPLPRSSHQPTALRYRAAALAALSQAVYLVDSIARKGVVDAEDFRAMLESLFADAGTTASPLNLYGDASMLQTGLRIGGKILRGEAMPQTKLLMTYSAGLLSLERRLSRDSDMRRKLAEGMQRIDKQRQYFGDPMHANVIAAVADLYGETISSMKPRIIVRGKSEYLSQTANTQRVRTLLMAGLRAAHIWHRHGGGHLNLLIRRKALLSEFEKLLQEATACK